MSKNIIIGPHRKITKKPAKKKRRNAARYTFKHDPYITSGHKSPIMSALINDVPSRFNAGLSQIDSNAVPGPERRPLMHLEALSLDTSSQSGCSADSETNLNRNKPLRHRKMKLISLFERRKKDIVDDHQKKRNRRDRAMDEKKPKIACDNGDEPPSKRRKGNSEKEEIDTGTESESNHQKQPKRCTEKKLSAFLRQLEQDEDVELDDLNGHDVAEAKETLQDTASRSFSTSTQRAQELTNDNQEMKHDVILESDPIEKVRKSQKLLDDDQAQQQNMRCCSLGKFGCREEQPQELQCKKEEAKMKNTEYDI